MEIKLKERLILMSMPISYEKCTKYDKDKSIMDRVIPFPDDILPILGRVMSTSVKNSTKPEYDIDELKLNFVTKSLDELFYKYDDEADSRYHKDQFIDTINSIKYVLESLWDKLYEITESVLNDSGILEKYK